MVLGVDNLTSMYLFLVNIKFNPVANDDVLETVSKPWVDPAKRMPYFIQIAENFYKQNTSFHILRAILDHILHISLGIIEQSLSKALKSTHHWKTLSSSFLHKEIVQSLRVCKKGS